MQKGDGCSEGWLANRRSNRTYDEPTFAEGSGGHPSREI